MTVQWSLGVIPRILLDGLREHPTASMSIRTALVGKMYKDFPQIMRSL
jgi:hypothetical protein